MLFGKYRFHNVLLDDALLPAYKGSTFRGAFGTALKRVVCAVREKECDACLLASRCLYAKTFESLVRDQVNRASRLAAPPHPYVIAPPPTRQTRFATGAPFDFSLLLFGETNEYLPYFVYAFESMGEGGIGKALSGRRGRFSVTDVTCAGLSIYDAGQRRLAPVTPKTLTLHPGQDDRDGELIVTLVTPLRLKFTNHYQADLPFHLLVRAMLRRVSSLLDCFGAGEPPLDYRGLVARAATVETVGSSLRWCDWQRYSNRQEEAMLMGGMIGEVSWRGRLGEYLPLLEFCKQVHLGKQTTFGLGQFEYSFRQSA